MPPLKSVEACLVLLVAVASMASGREPQLSAAATLSATGAMAMSTKPVWAIPSPFIANSEIDGHIPKGVVNSDRSIVRAVMLALPPSFRQDLVWLHVPPGKYGYDELPNSGLIVMFDDTPADARSASLPGLYVLYFDGHVQLDGNVIYASTLDKYLTVVPTRLRSSICPGNGQRDVAAWCSVHR